MIQKTTAYTVNGVTHATIQDAQAAAISDLVKANPSDPGQKELIGSIVSSREAVICILKMRERRARTTKPKAVKTTKTKPATQAAP